MCKDCIFWKKMNNWWGDCTNIENRVKFIPYTVKPEMFRETIEQFNSRQRPSEIPHTTADSTCPYRKNKDE